MAIKETLLHLVGAGEETAPDALDLLKKDHALVKELFSEVLKEDAAKIGRRRKTIDRILHELALHAKIEESLFYPALTGRSKKNTDDREHVLEAYEEHGSMKDLMRKIERTDSSDESLKAKVQVLSEIVDHHVREEEATVFHEARRLLGADGLHELGAAILRAKARAGAKNGSTKRGPAGSNKRATTRATR